MLVLQQMIIFVLLMVVFTNIGFMGVPMIDGIYGKDALIYMTVLLIPFITSIYWLPAAALATPSGNVIPLLAAIYNKEAYPVSVQGIAVTTAAAVVTMPLVAMATGLG